MSKLYERSQTQVIGTDDRKVAGALIYFFNAGTTTPLPVYSDSALTTPRTHPVAANANGIIPDIFLDYIDYRVRVTTSLGVVLSDTDNISNVDPATGSGGGGGGDPVAADQLIQTGDVIWSLLDGLRTGFVRVNARTIGSATSGATERANPDTEALYTFLWNNVVDAYCPVTGGRGANPAADFAANKPLALPNAQGKALWGLDTMGGNAANIAQRSTTINTTNLSASATVASAAGLAIGMYVATANVAAGTTITAISGLTLTLSSPATLTAAGTAARFSSIIDAEKPGATGGSQSHTLIQRELSSALGTAVSTVTNGTLVFRGGVLNAQAGANATGPSSIDNVSVDTTISNPLGGNPHPTMPPGIVGTFFMKL